MQAQIYPPHARAWLDVDLGALISNARALRARAGVPLIPMVKADAYGVGAAAVVSALEPLHPWGYGVATVAEGAQLRALGVDRPVIVFTPLLPDDFAAVRDARLTPTLGSVGAITAWGAAGAPYHLAIDTGMARAGVDWREAGTLRDVVTRFPPAGAFTHFHSAERNDGSAAEQLARFDAALRAIGTPVPFRHAANSAGIVRGHVGDCQAVRPGVFLYGVGSGAGASEQPEPVIHLRGRIVETRWLEAGDTVSYGAAYTATGRERIATVAAGYGDGYPRGGDGPRECLVNGRRASVRGAVTMDMTMVDISAIPCEAGDVVTLIGRNGDDLITVEQVAAAAAMSPYELLTGLAARAPREYRAG